MLINHGVTPATVPLPASLQAKWLAGSALENGTVAMPKCGVAVLQTTLITR